MKLYACMAVLVLTLLLPLTAHALPLCSWPSYENTARVWGRVVGLQTATVGGQPWVAFSLVVWKASDTTTPTSGNWVRIECGTDAAVLGCDQVATGDSILLSGHLENYVSCRIDGPDDYTVPNVIYRCTDHVPGTCLQLTPCS
jgi:hypothetical protein